MDLSFSSMFFHDASIERIIQAVGLSGADSIEFWLETPDFWLNGLDEEKMRALMDLHPFNKPLSVHAPVLDLNPCSINPDIREVSIGWISRSILLAERLGARVCTIHPGKRTAKRAPGITDYLRLGQMLDFIEPVAEETKVQVAIENMGPAVNALLTLPDEIVRLLDTRPWLWFTLDVAHAQVLGDEVIQAFIDDADGRIVNIHLSSGNGKEMHRPVSSDLNDKRALEIIADSSYNGLITLEINDLTLPSPLNYHEKVDLLSGQIELVRSFLQ